MAQRRKERRESEENMEGGKEKGKGRWKEANYGSLKKGRKGE